MITDEQLNEVFYNPSHETNEVLRRMFGTEDWDGFLIYSPTKAEMREQLEILAMVSHRIDNNEVNPGTECGASVHDLEANERIALMFETPSCDACRGHDYEEGR